MNPYYSDDTVTIYHGDCRDVLPRLSLPAHGIVTDPPYGDTSQPWDRWPDGWLASTQARQLWCFGSMRMWLSHHAEFSASGFTYSQEVVWEKHNGSGFHADRFKRVHELAVHWYRGPWSEVPIAPVKVNEATARRIHRKRRPHHTGDIGESHFEAHEGGPKLQRSVIYARSCHGYADHPTQKPLDILAPLVAYSAETLIVDPFTGSGSTLIAARAQGRAAIGIELQERYCEIAARRLEGSLPL